MTKLPETLLLRQEPFGGILTRFSEGMVKFLDEPQFLVAKLLAQKVPEPKLREEVLKRFDISRERATEIIAYLSHALNEAEAWDEDKIITDPFSKERLPRVPTLSFPLDLHWEVTRRCNLLCAHCYNNSDKQGFHPRLDNLLAVVDEIEANTKLRSVTVSGGDPLMRRDLKVFLERLRKVCFNLTLATNGTLFSNANIEWISKTIDALNISLDSAISKDYDAFRGQSGAFDRCIAGIKLCKQVGIPVVAQSTVSKLNINNLHELGDLLVDLGVDAWSLRLPFQSGRKCANEDVFIPRSEYGRYITFFDEFYKTYVDRFRFFYCGIGFSWSFQRPYESCSNSDQLLPCSGGTVLASIRADGYLTACPLFAETDFLSEKPIWETSLAHEWANSQVMNQMREISLSDISGCSTCSNINSICSGGCRAKSYLEFGKLAHRDPDCNYNYSR